MLLNEGKVKSVHSTDKDTEVIISFGDKITAGNGEKEMYSVGKGAVCSLISEILFKQLEKEAVSTHFISRVGRDGLLCHKVNIVPIEVVVRNIAAGGLVRETCIQKGIRLSEPLVEFYLKDDSKNDPLLTPGRLSAMGYSHILTNLMETIAILVNYSLKDVFDKIDMDLVDFKLEFGHAKDSGHLLLADELSPDGMRLWKKGTTESFDKDIFRDGEERDIVEAYRHILRALQEKL